MTTPFARFSATEQAIVQAIDFHEMIGISRKQERLKYLRNYWIARAQKEIPGFKLGSPKTSDSSCGIALFSIEGRDGAELSGRLNQKYRIHTVAIDWENIKGIRITPNVYTLVADLDRFIAALQQI